MLTFDWSSLRGYVFEITNCLAGANGIVQAVKQKAGRMTEDEWRGIRNRNKYIYRMAHDHALVWLADEKRQRAAAKRVKKTTILDPDLLQRIKQPRARQAFILRKQYGLSAKEIAKEMDLGVDTVKEYLAIAAKQFPTLKEK